MDKTKRKEIKQNLIESLKAKLAERQAILDNLKARQATELQTEQDQVDLISLQLEAFNALK